MLFQGFFLLELEPKKLLLLILENEILDKKKKTKVNIIMCGKEKTTVDFHRFEVTDMK